uniref:Glycosyltransferase 2-like domain-containing protein n=1 Tax=viral metagenome TaxID=1070528 RepID=A0A6C0DIM8_9ZZZZ
MELTIGILSYNSHKTLYNTLLSYEKSGLLDYTDDVICIIQPSNSQNEEHEICKKFNISNIILNKVNTKMAGGIDSIQNNAKYENILFLENDFRVCINKEKLYKILDHSLDILKKNEVDVVRLRSLKNPGHPIQHNLYKNMFNLSDVSNNSNDILRQMYLVTHYLENPEIILPDYIKKIYENPLTYLMTSKNCVYTNNPHIIKKSFYNQYVKPYVKDGCNLESEIDTIWSNFQYKIAITQGCFTHMRMDGHNNCGCCPIEYGGLSNDCIFICCNETIKKPKIFEVSDLM